MILVDLIDRIVSLISEKDIFPELKAVDKYMKIGKGLSLPVCSVETGDFDIETDPGTEQLHVAARFEVRVIVGPEAENAQEKVRALAVRIATHIFKMERLNENAGPWEIIDIEEDVFRPDLSSFLVWLVTVRVPVYNGKSVFEENTNNVE